ncbi:MAG: ArsR/SmtB family transcription factor [Promethearchaeota archaeon]
MNLHKLRLNLLKALADETRLEILSYLRHGERLCSCDMEKKINKSQSTLSRHFNKLVQANIINGEKEGVKMMYQIRDPRIFKLITIIDNIIKRNKEFKQIVEIQESI